MSTKPTNRAKTSVAIAESFSGKNRSCGSGKRKTSCAKLSPQPKRTSLAAIRSPWNGSRGSGFFPMREPQWAPSTKETNLYNLERHLLPALGTSPLAELDKFHCQVFLNKLAQRGLSFTIVDHNRTMRRRSSKKHSMLN